MAIRDIAVARTVAGLRQAVGGWRAKGERVGTVPFGARLAADGVRLEADAIEQRLIARMLTLRAEGLTTRSIADALNVSWLVGSVCRFISRNE